MPDLFVDSPAPMTFTICKIEAGKALLISEEENYEMLEFPSKLLKNKQVNEQVRICVESGTNNTGESIEELLGSVINDFGVSSVELERLKEELSNDFLKIERLGCTAVILAWKRGIRSLFPKSIEIQSIDLEVSGYTSSDKSDKFTDAIGGILVEYVDFVVRGLDRIEIDDVMTRVSLPISLKCRLSVSTSVGRFQSNQILIVQEQNLYAPMEDFSKLFLVTDLDSSDDKLKRIRQLGGYIERSIRRDQPITAIVLKEMNPELFNEALQNNLPVVALSWLDALLQTNELPHFEDHLLSQ